jgi:hypothetical protein
VKPFTQDDLARASCGATEDIQAAGSSSDDAGASNLEVGGMFWVKVLGGTSLAWALTGGIGAIGGLIAGVAWWASEYSRELQPFGAALPPPPEGPSPTVDKVAPANTTGKVIHPADVTLPNVTPANAVAWPTDGTTNGNRRYDLYVDRDATVLWAGDPQAAGFAGRWGPRVEHDSFLRRSGMLFPNFWRMFFDALVIMDVPGGTAPPPPTPTQKPIPQTDGTPIGNATQTVPLSAAYDGNFDKTTAESPTGFDPDGVYIGKRYPQMHRFSGITVRLSSDLGYLGNDPTDVRNCTVYGKSDIDPQNPTDRTVLFRFPAPGLPDQAGLKVDYLTGFDTTNTYDRVWVTLDDPGEDGLTVFTQVVWYATDF